MSYPSSLRGPLSPPPQSGPAGRAVLFPSGLTSAVCRQGPLMAVLEPPLDGRRLDLSHSLHRGGQEGKGGVLHCLCCHGHSLYCLR